MMKLLIILILTTSCWSISYYLLNKTEDYRKPKARQAEIIFKYIGKTTKPTVIVSLKEIDLKFSLEVSKEFYDSHKLNTPFEYKMSDLEVYPDEHKLFMIAFAVCFILFPVILTPYIVWIL